MQPFLALITPLAGGPYPDQGLPGPQPQPPRPPGIWGPTDPRPGYGLPGGQPYPDQGLPGSQPRPDQGLPGSQPRPDQGLPGGQGGQPTHPIYIPPEGGQPPLGIWGPTDPRPGTGLPGPQPHPEHPIVLPPGLPPTIPGEGGGPERKVEWKTAWTQQTGWIVIGIPAEGTPVPTPSGQQGQQPAQPKK